MGKVLDSGNKRAIIKEEQRESLGGYCREISLTYRMQPVQTEAALKATEDTSR